MFNRDKLSNVQVRGMFALILAAKFPPFQPRGACDAGVNRP